jgi:hypothetical protein
VGSRGEIITPAPTTTRGTGENGRLEWESVSAAGVERKTTYQYDHALRLSPVISRFVSALALRSSANDNFSGPTFTRNLLSALDLASTQAAKRFCREALALDRRLFRLWHRFRGDPAARGSPLTRAELISKVLPD